MKTNNRVKNDENTPPESFGLRLKKAERAVEVAKDTLKSLRTVVEREGGIAKQTEQGRSDHLLKELKKLKKEQTGVRKVLDKP